MSARIFTNEEMTKAMQRIAEGKAPKWMNAIEQQAYVLGVINREHIIPHERCKGRGWLPDPNPYADAECSCPGSKGQVISEDGKALILEAFPDYEASESSGKRKQATVPTEQDNLSTLLSIATPQDVLLGIMCVSEKNRLRYNAVSVMNAFHQRTHELDQVPGRMHDLFEHLATGGRTDGFYDSGFTIWCDGLESALGLLPNRQGVETVVRHGRCYYQIDSIEHVRYYLINYWKGMTQEERTFLEELAFEINGR
jgi:hypothetical protein